MSLLLSSVSNASKGDRFRVEIELEQLGNELAQTHSFHVRCAYPMTEELKGEPYATLCAEHSAVLTLI